MQVIFRTNKKKITTGEMILKNNSTVIVRLDNGKKIKRHIQKHCVRIHPKDREEFLKLRSVKKPRRQPLMLAQLPDGYQQVII